MNKNILTQEGLDKIINHFKELQEEKKYWVEEKRIAAEHGDRSENAEYHAAKENIRRIDKKLFHLNNIINNAKPIDTSNRKKDIVVFGSTVTLLKNEEENIVITIVGTNELLYHGKDKSEEKKIYVSHISPMGKELLGKTIGYEFDLMDNFYEIVGIE
jgi:transcription elongation GreA/GreB family factor